MNRKINNPRTKKISRLTLLCKFQRLTSLQCRIFIVRGPSPLTSTVYCVILQPTDSPREWGSDKWCHPAGNVSCIFFCFSTVIRAERVMENHIYVENTLNWIVGRPTVRFQRDLIIRLSIWRIDDTPQFSHENKTIVSWFEQCERAAENETESPTTHPRAAPTTNGLRLEKRL